MNARFVDFWKKVGIVGSGVVVAGTIIGIVTSFAWRIATAPIVDAIAEERESRTRGDTLIIRRLEQIDDRNELRFDVLAEALHYPEGSRDRERALARLDIHSPARTAAGDGRAGRRR